MIIIILQYLKVYNINHKELIFISSNVNYREYMRYDYDFDVYIMNSYNDPVALLHRYYWTYKIK